MKKVTVQTIANMVHERDGSITWEFTHEPVEVKIKGERIRLTFKTEPLVQRKPH